MNDSNPSYKTRAENRGGKLSDYRPLIVLIAIALLASFAICISMGVITIMGWMHYFMGVFLCIFAMLKLFHPAAFADGFQMYDLLGKRSRLYAYIYPYIELLLGLAYLSFFMPKVTFAATIVVMGFGALGVISALKKGLDINCPCMGSVLDVPLSTVTLTEDLGMALMAAGMLGVLML